MKRAGQRRAELEELLSLDPENAVAQRELAALNVRTLPPTEMRKWADELPPGFDERAIGRILGLNEGHAEARVKLVRNGPKDPDLIAKVRDEMAQGRTEKEALQAVYSSEPKGAGLSLEIQRKAWRNFLTRYRRAKKKATF